MNYKTLWEEFSKIPIDIDGKILEDFYAFKKGTNKFVVWYWFEETFNISIVRDIFDYDEIVNQVDN